MAWTTSTSRALTVWVAPKVRPVKLRVIGVDRDDPFGADQRGTGDRGIANAAAADHRDGVVAGYPAGVDRGAQAGHDPATQQAGHRGIGSRIDLRALARVHQRLIGKGPDAQRRSELGAVGQRHLLFGVKGVEAVAGPSAFAGPALAAHGTPVQDHEVAGLDCGYTRPDGLDDARGLVSEQKRVFVVDAALAVGQVGMAYPAGGDVDHGLAGSGIRDDNVHQLNGFALLSCDHTAHRLTHGVQPTV